VRRLVTLACLVVCARGLAEEHGGRVRWLGVSSDGHAPAALDKAGVAHVAVALRQLGLTLVSLPPSSADASASCSFATPRTARCLVVVQSSSGAKADRHAQIPFHDAEDLAESLALIVSDMLTTQFPEVLTTPPPPAPPPPAMTTPPAAPEPPREEPRPPRRESEAERQRAAADERARQAELARQADYEERAQKQTQASPRAPFTVAPPHLILEAAATGLFTVGQANPTIGGALIRVLWSGGPLRAGGTLSLGGASQSAGTYALGWFRGLIAARVGAGLRRGLVDFDTTLGPALLLAYADAHAAGHHLFASIAFVVGPHLSIGLTHGLSVALGGDLQVAVTEEKVVAGSTTVAQLSRFALEASLGLSWRR
jgi:hypothetical protein